MLWLNIITSKTVMLCCKLVLHAKAQSEMITGEAKQA